MGRLPAFLLVALQATLSNYFSRIGDDSPLYGRLQSSYDYIIVGGGTAGAVLASRLSEEPDSVLVIEAGRSDQDNENVRIPAYYSAIQQTRDDWNYFTEPQTVTGLAMNGRRGYWARGRVLGGCSSTGNSIYHRGAQFDYDEWAAQGAVGWSYREVLPYFLKSEDMRIPGLAESVFHSTGGPLTVEPGFSTPIQEYFQQASNELLFPTIDCNGPTALGFCPLQANIRNGERCSSMSCFLRNYLNRRNLQVIINTLVSKIIIRNKKAVGVEIHNNGRRLQVFANKEVIISAGAINSPQLLMLSGIGPAHHLDRFRIPVVADLPVGNNLQDQPTMFLHFALDQNITYNTETLTNPVNIAQWLVSLTGPLTRPGIDGTLFAKTIPSLKTPPTYPDIMIQSFSEASDRGAIEYGFKLNLNVEVIDNQLRNRDSSGFNLAPMVIRPESRGFIRLNTTDPRQAPVIRPNHFSSMNDVHAMIRGIRLIQKLISTNSFSAIKPKYISRNFDTICSRFLEDSDEYWYCMLRYFSHHNNRPCCTNRMGARTDPTAVVDSELRVKGIGNLRVVDSSVMRNSIAGGPHAAAIMIAEKAADLIRRIDTVGKWKKQIAHLFP